MGAAIMGCNGKRIPHALMSVTEERECSLETIESFAERAAAKKKTQPAILEGLSQGENLINIPSQWPNSRCAATRY